MEGPFLAAFLSSAAAQASLAERRLTRILAQIAAGRPAEHFPNNFDFFLGGRAAVVHTFLRLRQVHHVCLLLHNWNRGVIVSLS